VANPKWMAEAVAPLFEVIGRENQACACPGPACQPSGSTDRRLALRKFIPRMAIWTSVLGEGPLEILTTQFQLDLALTPALNG
jgi:hypothetical protein